MQYQTLRLISTKFLPRRCVRVVVNRHLLHRNASRLHTTLLNIGRYWVPHWPHLSASHDSPHPCRRSLMPPRTARKRSLYSLLASSQTTNFAVQLAQCIFRQTEFVGVCKGDAVSSGGTYSCQKKGHSALTA